MIVDVKHVEYLITCKINDMFRAESSAKDTKGMHDDYRYSCLIY